jgi:hypothetical protein
VQALAWLKERVTILRDGEQEIQEFSNWNARAIYFYDADHNVVELIARRNLGYTSEEYFHAGQFRELSEIGLPSTHIKSTYEYLHREMNLEVFDGSFDRFCAIGDERGLFICVHPERKSWYPCQDPIYASPFSVQLKNEDLSYHLSYRKNHLQIRSTGT